MKKLSPQIKYGLIAGVAVGLLSMLFLITNINLSPIFQEMIAIGVIISCVLLSIQSHAISLNKIEFKDLFIQGFRTTAILSLVFIGFGLITLNAFPNIKKDSLAKWEKEATQFIVDDSAKAVAELNVTDSTLRKLKLDTIAAKTVTYKKDFATNKNFYVNNYYTIFIGQNLLKCMIVGLFASVLCALLIIWRRKQQA